jgi:UDP-glucose 4-epimerase
MSLSRRIAITGASGYLGQVLVRHLLARLEVERVLGLDVKPGLPINDERYQFISHDVCQSCSALLAEHGIEAVVHLAFCFAPLRNRKRATKINVGGSQQLLKSCAQAGVPTLLYCSSGTAYGALPTNHRPLREDDPLGAVWAFQYAYEKRLTDQMWQDFARQHVDVRVIIARPCVVMGPRVDNYLSRMIDKPILFLVRGKPPAMQFIHEDDVAEGIVALLERSQGGVYNLAPSDTVTLPDIARLFGRPVLRLPARLMYPLTRATYFLGIRAINEVPAGFLDFVRYQWLLDAGRVERELGWRCRHSSREAIEDWHGSLMAR